MRWNVVDVLADHKTDAAYKKAMELAKKEEETSQNDFISLFVKYWKQEGNGRPLAAIFATQQMKGKVSTSSSDSEVENALRAEVQSAVDNSFNVVRNRIDKFGVVQPNIQKLEGQSGRIMVEMPGIKELSVFVSSSRVQLTSSSGRPTTHRRLLLCSLSSTSVGQLRAARLLLTLLLLTA